MNTYKSNYYAVLGVESSATFDEIKKAYRLLARRYHPDLNPTNKKAEEQFKTVNEAYQVLLNLHQRQKYERTYLANKKIVSPKTDSRVYDTFISVFQGYSASSYAYKQKV